MTCVLFLFVLLVPNLLLVNCARILAFFPAMSISHQFVFRPLTQELAKHGHDVVVITPDPAFSKGECPENLTEIDVHDSYKVKDELFDQASNQNKNLRTQIELISYVFVKGFEQQIRNPEVTALINDKDKKFDLLLLEACNRVSLALTNIYKIPTIQISSFGSLEMNNKVYGLPIHPLLYPTLFHQRVNNLTYWEKLKELHNHYDIESVIEGFEVIENKLMRGYFGDDFPSLIKLTNNVNMMFLNIHPIWEYNRPTVPNAIYLGCLHQVPKRELPDSLKSYMDSSENGIIYFSFGTNVKCSYLSKELINVFLKVFSKLPYDVLWKCDVENFLGLTKNIKIGKWFPQSDLLRHKKIKLFITQGGLQSTDEAIAAGVPLIGIPILSDQWYNVEHYVYHKIGVRLNKETITEEQLMKAINTVINDNSYRRNVVKLRSVMNDQPQRPLERAVWWTEHVLRHRGGTHLRAPAANMPWTEYYEVELFFLLIFTIIILIMAVVSLKNAAKWIMLHLYHTNLPVWLGFSK